MSAPPHPSCLQLYRLHLSLKSLARKQPVESVRFWGKIYGTQKDYYVAEAKMKDGARALGLRGTRTTRSRICRAMRASQPARRDSLVHTGSREPPPAEEEPAAEDEEGEGAKEPKPPKIVYPPYEEPGTPASRRARRPASQPARLSLESGQHCAQAPSAPSGAASGHAWLGSFAYLAPNAFSSLLHRLGR